MSEKILDFCSISGDPVKKYDGIKKYVATGDIIDNKISSYAEFDYSSKPSRANQVAKIGEVLFAKMKDTIKVITINKENSEYIYSTGFYIIKPKENVLTDYLYWLFNSPKFNVDKDKYCKGATQKALNNDGLGKITIKELPKIEMQKKIVSKFNKINTIINKKKEQLDILDELIKSQFVEMFGDPKLNDKNWIKAPMGDYMTVLTDFSSNGSYKTLDSTVVMYDEPNYAYMVRTTDLENEDYKSNVKYITEEAYNFLSKSKVYPDDIIMNKIGSAGKVYIMPDVGMPVSLGRNAFLFRYKSDIVPLFIYYLLKSEYGTNEISQYVRGAVTKTITKDDVRKVKIIVPPIELQNKFADFVKQIDKQKFEIQKSLDEMQELYKSLMDRYFG